MPWKTSSSRVDRDRDAKQYDQPDQVATGTGDHRLPDRPDGIHIRLHALDQKTWGVLLVKGPVLHHHPVQQIDPHISRRLLLDACQQHLLHHTRHGAQDENAHQHQTNPEQCAFLTSDEDLIEHRLHQLCQPAHGRGLDRHENDRDKQYPHMLFQIVAPKPGQQFARGIGHITHIKAGSFGHIQLRVYAALGGRASCLRALCD